MPPPPPPLQSTGIAGEGTNSTPSTPSDESDNKSFFSAEVNNNTSPHHSASDQSENAPPLTPSSTQTSPHDASDISSNLSSTALSKQRTPLARKHTASSPGPKPSPLSTVSHSTSYFQLQPPASPSDPRAPPTRRAPASRSSHGIETRSGPPPALITQRSYNADAPWRRYSHSEHNDSSKLDDYDPTQTHSRPDNVEDKSDTMNGFQARKDARNRRSLDVTSAIRRARAGNGADQNLDGRLNGRHTQSNSFDVGASRPKEDLFLNLARLDRPEDQGLQSPRTSSGFVSQESESTRTPRPSSSDKPPSRGSYFPQRSSNTAESTLQPRNTPSLPLKSDLLASTARDRPYSASAHPLDPSQRARHTRYNTDQLSYSSPNRDENTRSLLAMRRRSMQNAPNPAYSSPLSHLQTSKRGPEFQSAIEDGTASTVSTTAPSTVWDELDDLKARIRKIELTGGALPTTSNAAISSAYRERPRTADTTLTAGSFSPSRRKAANSSPDPSVIPERQATGSSHLLQAAITRAKARVTPSVYTALESAASDALAFAAMTGGKNAGGINGSPPAGPSVDRQLRRKADNMCRSLTELCIALAEGTGSENNMRQSLEPHGRQAAGVRRAQSVVSPQEASKDPDLNASSRVLTRLEARRTSLRAASTASPQNLSSTPEPTLPTAAVDTPRPGGGLDRSNSVIRRREVDTESPTTQRPLSRAATDAGHRPRKSREYVSDYPMPNAGEARKSYFPSSNHSTPGDTSSVSNGRVAEARERRLAGMGYGSSPHAPMSYRRLPRVGVKGS